MNNNATSSEEENNNRDEIEMKSCSTTRIEKDAEQVLSCKVNEMPIEEIERYLDVNYETGSKCDDESIKSVQTDLISLAINQVMVQTQMREKTKIRIKS